MKKTIIFFIAAIFFFGTELKSQELAKLNNTIYAEPILDLSQETLEESNSTETDNKNELLVKFDVFYPLVYLFVNDGDEYTYGMAMEYKLKNRFSINLSGYFFQFADESVYYKGFRIIPEGRYYFKGHFIGAFIKYEKRNVVDGPIYLVSTGRLMEYEYLWTLGGLYGYQLELGRLNIEGRLGIGAAHNFYHHVESRGYDNDNSKGSFSPEMILAVNIGYRIF